MWAVFSRPARSPQGRLALALLVAVGVALTLGGGRVGAAGALLIQLCVVLAAVTAVHEALGGTEAYPIGPGRAALYTVLPASNLAWALYWPTKVLGWWAAPTMLLALGLEIVGGHGAAAMCVLAFAHLALRRPRAPVEPVDPRTLVLFDTLWICWVVAFFVTPPDVLTTILLAAPATLLAAVVAWQVLGRISARTWILRAVASLMCAASVVLLAVLARF